jgi:gibberellin 2-oxidase
MDSIAKLESEALNFFNLPLSQKQKASAPHSFGYGNKSIGLNGDIGWLEYLLLTTNQELNNPRLVSIFGEDPEIFWGSIKDYVEGVKKMSCEILEMLAEGLKIEEKDVFSRLLMNQESDSLFRINHYPPCPSSASASETEGGLRNNNNNNNNNNNEEQLIGFGEHTDPQIISVLRSNNTSGLQISLKDGDWISVPPDQYSFFVNVGDSLQVMTNGRFKSVKHRVLANSRKARLSMIYFGGPPLSEKIAPLPSLLIKAKEDSLYKEFTWFEYKKSAFNSRLADNRLGLFEKISAA